MRRAGISRIFGSLVFAWPIEAIGYLESHPPFPFGETAPWSSVTAEPVLEYAEGTVEFPEDGVRISVRQASKAQRGTTSVWLNGKIVFDTAAAHPELHFALGSRVFYVDLTGDVYRDISIFSYPDGVGVAALYEQVDLLVREPNDRSTKRLNPSERAEAIRQTADRWLETASPIRRACRNYLRLGR